MIDRTTFDLRIAAHQATTARIGRQEWQRQGPPTRSPLRRTVAAVLMTLAVRIDPRTVLARQDATTLPAPTSA